MKEIIILLKLKKGSIYCFKRILYTRATSMKSLITKHNIKTYQIVTTRYFKIERRQKIRYKQCHIHKPFMCKICETHLHKKCFEIDHNKLFLLINKMFFIVPPKLHVFTYFTGVAIIATCFSENCKKINIGVKTLNFFN